MEHEQKEKNTTDKKKFSLKPIIQYVQGGYFGDSDIFAQIKGIAPMYVGRDSSAIADNDVSIFMMRSKEIKIIRNSFPEIFEEMSTLALKRYKRQSIMIARAVKQYIDDIKLTMDRDYVEDKLSENSLDFNDKSLNSDNIDQDFEKAN